MRRRKAALFAVLLAAAVALCGGCTKSRELKDMDIVEGMGVDLADGGQYLVTYQIFQSQSETNGEKVKVLQATGATLFDAGRNVTLQTGKRLYYANQSAFIVGSEVARKGITPIIDYFSRNHELRISQRIFMAEGRAADILTAQGPDGIIPASTLELISRNREYTGKTLDMQGMNVLERIATGSDDVLLPTVIHRSYTPGGNTTQSQAGSSPGASPGQQSQSGSQGGGSSSGSGSSSGGGASSQSGASSASGSGGGSQDPQTRQVLELERTAVFNKERKLVGFLNANQTRGYQWTNSNAVSGVLVLTMPDQSKVSIEIKSNQCNTTVSQDAFTFHLSVSAILTEQENNQKDVFDQSYRDELAHMVEKQVESDVRDAVNTAFFGMQSDIFRIGTDYFRLRPEQWRMLSKDWPASGQKLKCNVEVKSTLFSGG